MAVVTTTFQQGVNGYSSTLDTMIQQKNPAVASGTSSEIGTDKDPGAEKQVLLRFDDLFGTGPGQIPTGAIITSASLTIRTTSASLQGASFHRILIDWDGSSTWNSLGSGLQADGLEATANADLTTGQIVTGSRPFDVANSLQAWATSGSTSETRNAANHGWLFKADGTDGWDFRSSEGSVKPLLSVTYTLPDVPPPPPVGVTVLQSNGTTAVAEGGANDSITLSLTAAPTEDVVITVNGSTDLSAAPATLIFTPTNWQTSQTVVLTAEDDAQYEGVETVDITFTSSSVDSRYNNLAIAPVHVGITDNDSPPQPTISIDAGIPEVQMEGANTKISFTFRLDHASEQAVTVSYMTVDGTALNGGDFYGLTDGSITFLPGETSKSIDIQLIDDTLPEALEYFFVQIKSAQNALVGTSNAAGYIDDNDQVSQPPSLPSVVKVHDTTQYKAGDPSGYGSGDPSGLCYLPTMDALFMCDSEHDESPYNSTTNLFLTKRDGSHIASFSMRSYTKEPTGVAFNPTNGYLYVTDDDKDRVYWVNPNNPTVKVGEFSVSSLGIADAEDPKFDPVTGNMFLLDGVSRRFFELTSQGKLVSSMSLPSQMKDAEAFAYDASNNVFYIASGASTNIYKMSRSGEILQTIDILGSTAYLNPITGSKPVPKGLELAPSSDPFDGSKMSLYVADYGVDQKNDGRLFEINLGSDWLLA